MKENNITKFVVNKFEIPVTLIYDSQAVLSGIIANFDNYPFELNKKTNKNKKVENKIGFLYFGNDCSCRKVRKT